MTFVTDIYILFITVLCLIDLDIDEIIDVIPDKSDLTTMLDGIKGDVKKWSELFRKRLLEMQKKVIYGFIIFLILCF